MLHEVWTALAEGGAPSPGTAHDVFVALIGASAPLILAFVTLFQVMKGRQRAVLPVTEQEERVRALETFLIRLHFNPNRIVTGEEEFADVSFT